MADAPAVDNQDQVVELSEEDLNEIQRRFPNVPQESIKKVLKSCKYNKEKTINALNHLSYEFFAFGKCIR